MSGGLTETVEVTTKRVQEVAEKKGWRISQVALACIRGKDCIPIVGLASTSIERLDEACAVGHLRLDEDELKYLEEPYVPEPIAGHFQIRGLLNRTHMTW